MAAAVQIDNSYSAAIDEALTNLIAQAQTYAPDLDKALIQRAFDYARKRHEGQLRISGEPYILHPLAVATILTELHMSQTVLAASLLHDLIEDCGVTREQIAAEFGDEIAELVDGVTKLKLADFETRAVGASASQDGDSSDAAGRKKQHPEISRSAANLRKILLAMARDLRVMIIKLADRLHNMRTLSALSPERQKKVAKETLEIFAPLAHRLGIWQIKWQLEDLAFKYVNPAAYEEISEKVSQSRHHREKELATATDILKRGLQEAGISAEISGRPKHLFSIYNKMRKEQLDFADIFDLVALRVIVNTLADCYHALGIVHETWMPIPGRFDDYIAKPKSNGYQSLHTKVIGPGGEPLEIQIRTWDMHQRADFGIAAHWQYKEGRGGDKNEKLFERKMTFLRQQLFDWQSDTKDESEFLRSVVNDLFTDQVFVFTPKGDVLDFPAGATPVDAAFRIHSDLGQHTAGAKVNGRIVPLSYVCHNGDIVDIITRPSANPSLDWLSFVKTSHARSKIKHYFRKLRHGENVARGREMLQKEAEHLHLDIHALLTQEHLAKVRETHFNNFHTEEDFLAAIGYGDVAVGSAIQRLRALLPQAHKDDHAVGSGSRRGPASGKLQIGGDLADVAIVRAKCCAPVPGDEVVGYMTRGKGIALHRQGCPNLLQYQKSEPKRLVEVDWKPVANGEAPQRFLTDIRIELADRVGLLEDVGKLFAEARTNIQAIRTRSNVATHTATMQISFDATDAAHIADVTTRLRRLSDVLDIRRAGANDAPVE